jgi:N-dimethylarginine dimethylaminohydrolase
MSRLKAGQACTNLKNENMINVNVDSEIGVLKKVILCYANPYKISLEEIRTALMPSVLLQFYHNKFSAYNYKTVQEEQKAFIKVLEDYGVEVLLADNLKSSSCQHYTRDIGFAIDDLFVVAKMGTPIRHKEKAAIAKYTNEFPKVASITKGSIEGGDVMLHKNKVIVGLGEGTNWQGINNLQELLAVNNIDREIVPIHFSHRGIIHLDTKFNIVGENVAVINPRSFKKESLKWLENNFNLIGATDEETSEILINTFSIAPTKLIMKQGSERIGAILEKKGITPIYVKYSEVTKLPGSLRCTTCPIERQSYFN